MNIQVRKATVNNINQWRVYVDGELAAGCPSEYWANEIAQNFRVRKEELELPLENTNNMKNIHLLPTEKPSRFHLSHGEKFYLSTEAFVPLDIKNYKSFNIYITSDEEIKEGDWVIKISSLYKGGGIIQKYSFIDAQFEDIIFKKIILTTDSDLIKDGVQKIDDSFLEWFVNKPSCESVEVEKGYLGMCGFVKSDEPISKDKLHYKIIIPQEEPKPVYQQIIDLVGGEKRFKELVGLEPKQETLEEAADIDSKNHYKDQSDYWAIGFDSFKRGANWQAKRMYSEEEVIAIVEKSRKTGLTAEYLLLTEPFKKK